MNIKTKNNSMVLSLDSGEEVAIEIGENQWIVVTKKGNKQCLCYKKIGSKYERLEPRNRETSKS